MAPKTPQQRPEDSAANSKHAHMVAVMLQVTSGCSLGLQRLSGIADIVSAYLATTTRVALCRPHQPHDQMHGSPISAIVYAS